jgi:hypothetical protein
MDGSIGRFRIVVGIACAIAAVAVLTACGGNPAGPGGDSQGVVLRGTVQGAEGLRAASFGAQASVATVTVSVLENPSISAAIGADGSFTLRGLPEGGFTLVFKNGAAEVGRLTFSEVKPNQEITVTVQVSDSGVLLLEEQRNGIGHGDVEIEGRVTQVITLSPTGDSRFLINGRTVVARPGETAVREGNRSRNIEDVTLDRPVHVKGVWLPAEGSTQPVLAHEIKLQGDPVEPGEDDNDGEDDDPQGPSDKCAAGQKVEVEGLISSKSGSTITVNQQGKGPFACEVGSARIRKGNTSYTVDQLQVGWRVHVSGTGQGESGGVCRVAADEVKVQNN